MVLNIDLSFQQGINAHNTGNLQEAESLYRTILQTQPTHPHANHNLGVIISSTSNPEASLPLFKAAQNIIKKQQLSIPVLCAQLVGMIHHTREQRMKMAFL